MIIEFDCENCGTHKSVRRGKNQQAPRYCSQACRVEGKRNEPPPFTREWLHQKYIVEALGCPEIGKLVGRDSTTIRYWLRKYDMPTRPRGHDARQHFKKGVQNRLGIKHSEEAKQKVGIASRARGAVPYLKNGKHHLAGKRGAASPTWKGGVTPERQAFYRSDEWKAACRAVWTRDDAKCRRCGLDSRKVDRRVISFDVHHIVTFANKVLRASPYNLILLCGNCHDFVHSRDNVIGEFLGDYWRWAVKYCQEAEIKRSAPTLFDLDALKAEAA